MVKHRKTRVQNNSNQVRIFEVSVRVIANTIDFSHGTDIFIRFPQKFAFQFIIIIFPKFSSQISSSHVIPDIQPIETNAFFYVVPEADTHTYYRTMASLPGDYRLLSHCPGHDYVGRCDSWRVVLMFFAFCLIFLKCMFVVFFYNISIHTKHTIFRYKMGMTRLWILRLWILSSLKKKHIICVKVTLYAFWHPGLICLWPHTAMIAIHSYVQSFSWPLAFWVLAKLWQNLLVA